jgi:hypothetical protein
MSGLWARPRRSVLNGVLEPVKSKTMTDVVELAFDAASQAETHNGLEEAKRPARDESLSIEHEENPGVLAFNYFVSGWRTMCVWGGPYHRDTTCGIAVWKSLTKPLMALTKEGKDMLKWTSSRSSTHVTQEYTKDQSRARIIHETRSTK